MYEVEMSEEEIIFIVHGMKVLMKVAEDNKRFEEAQVWEDLIIKYKKAAIPRWVLELKAQRSEKETSL